MPRSGIRAIMDLAWATPGATIMAAGEPDFATPPHIVAAAIAALHDGHTKYVQNAGIPPLREAIADKIRSRNGYAATAANVVVAAGGVEALFATLSVLLDPGDAVMLPDPGWPNFAMMAMMLRAEVRPYALRSTDGYLPTIADLEAAVTSQTRVLLINSPSNPLGAVIDRERMTEIAAFAERHDLWIVADECYDEIVFDDRFVSAAAIAGLDRVVSCYTFSKSYAMTGWRVGYAVAPERVAAQIAKVQEPLISCVNVPAQYGALAALRGPHAVVEDMRESYHERRDAALSIARDVQLSAFEPAGAFYLWFDVREAGLPSVEFAAQLLEEERLALAPGAAFGTQGEGFVRMSIATEANAVYAGVRALGRFMRRRTSPPRLRDMAAARTGAPY